MRLICLCLAAAALLPAQVVILKNANVIDGKSAQPQMGMTVTVRDGKIESLQAGDRAAPAGATVLDLKGKWLLPGLVDAHVHISSIPDARRALNSGVTTVRSMGVNHFVDVGMRELHRGGALDLPDFIASGYHIQPQLSEGWFLDFPKLLDLMPTVSGVANLRRLVRANIERGAQVIKTLSTERAGLPEADPRKRVFNEDELSAIVQEAKAAGIPVAAHAHGDEGGMAAVRAGVHSIEHGTFFSDETLAEMKKRGTFLLPTLATVRDLSDSGGEYDGPIFAVRGRFMFPRVREVTMHAQRMGIKIAAGTDTAYGANTGRRLSMEIIELAQAGLTPLQAIQAATSVAAEVLGIQNRTGSIQAGLEADLVAVERDPREDLATLGDIVLVINNGKVMVNRLNW